MGLTVDTARTECLIEAGETIPKNAEASEKAGYKQILQLKAVHLLAIFLILYIGVEVTIGGEASILI